MTKNIEDLLYRGDSLEKMGEMSGRLREDSRKYKRAAVRMNWELLIKMVSLTIALFFCYNMIRPIADLTLDPSTAQSLESFSSSLYFSGGVSFDNADPCASLFELPRADSYFACGHLHSHEVIDLGNNGATGKEALGGQSNTGAGKALTDNESTNEETLGDGDDFSGGKMAVENTSGKGSDADYVSTIGDPDGSNHVINISTAVDDPGDFSGYGHNDSSQFQQNPMI
jgi:hypothetical protein